MCHCSFLPGCATSCDMAIPVGNRPQPPTKPQSLSPPSPQPQSVCSIIFKFVSFLYGPYLLIMVPLLTSKSKARTVLGVCGYILNPTYNNRDEFVFLGRWQVSRGLQHITLHHTAGTKRSQIVASNGPTPPHPTYTAPFLTPARAPPSPFS